jgi:hypothetical protein
VDSLGIVFSAGNGHVGLVILVNKPNIPPNAAVLQSDIALLPQIEIRNLQCTNLILNPLKLAAQIDGHCNTFLPKWLIWHSVEHEVVCGAFKAHATQRMLQRWEEGIGDLQE